jgi:hypothetical protein
MPDPPLKHPFQRPPTVLILLGLALLVALVYVLFFRNAA